MFLTFSAFSAEASFLVWLFSTYVPTYVFLENFVVLNFEYIFDILQKWKKFWAVHTNSSWKYETLSSLGTWLLSWSNCWTNRWQILCLFKLFKQRWKCNWGKLNLFRYLWKQFECQNFWAEESTNSWKSFGKVQKYFWSFWQDMGWSIF